MSDDGPIRPVLARVPAGAFAMGCADGLPDERPVHPVWTDAFEIAVRPVTNREFARFVAATDRRRAGVSPELSKPDQPVVAVTWFDATAYCEWLTERLGQRFRLPTEAEREKAARGGRDSSYPWGDDPDGEPSAARGAPGVVGLDSPNGYGLHNMGDLVHEWCSDWYAADYYAASPGRNPAGPERGRRRASRGGSWRHRVTVTRCAARSSLPPDRAYDDYGFRVVREL